MSNRWIPLTLGAATAIPFGLLGGFGPTGDHSILPWLGIVAGWTYQSPFHVELAGRRLVAGARPCPGRTSPRKAANESNLGLARMTRSRSSRRDRDVEALAPDRRRRTRLRTQTALPPSYIVLPD